MPWSSSIYGFLSFLYFFWKEWYTATFSTLKHSRYLGGHAGWEMMTCLHPMTICGLNYPMVSCVSHKLQADNPTNYVLFFPCWLVTSCFEIEKHGRGKAWLQVHKPTTPHEFSLQFRADWQTLVCQQKWCRSLQDFSFLCERKQS